MNNKTPEQLYDEQYPEKDFKKSIFQFSNDEKMELSSYNSMIQVAQMAEIIANQIVNTKVLPRLGQKVTSDSQVYYDVPTGKIVTWIPKVICENCKNKRAEFQMGTKKLCQTCVDLAQQEKKPVATIEKKKAKK